MDFGLGDLKWLGRRDFTLILKEREGAEIRNWSM